MYMANIYIIVHDNIANKYTNLFVFVCVIGKLVRCYENGFMCYKAQPNT